MSGVEWFPGVKRGDCFGGSQGCVVLRAPEGSFFGVQAGLGVPKGCMLGPTFVV